MDPKNLRLWSALCWADQGPSHWPGQAGPPCSKHSAQCPRAECVRVGGSASSLWPWQLHHLSQGWDFALLSEDRLQSPSLAPGLWSKLARLIPPVAGPFPACLGASEGRGVDGVFLPFQSRRLRPRERIRNGPLQCGGRRQGAEARVFLLLLTFRAVNLVGHAVLLPHRRDPVRLHHPQAPAGPCEVAATHPVPVDKSLEFTASFVPLLCKLTLRKPCRGDPGPTLGCGGVPDSRLALGLSHSAHVQSCF